MKNLSILGSTGSIGRNVLNVVGKFPEKYSVKALAAATNVNLFAEQIIKFNPDIAVVLNAEYAGELLNLLPTSTPVRVLFGDDGYREAAIHPEVNMVVSSIVGAAGLLPTVAAIEAGKDIALANKETLVMAGDYVMNLAAAKGVNIFPVDSEHSAVFQCIEGQKKEALSKIMLTASGGPFRCKPLSEFNDITLSDALNHPTWQMGKKISIDSSTLMNKGLEVIEAKFLFNIPCDIIEVVVHPQSIVHSMVGFQDGSVLAQLGAPDMRGAISYAMSWPERLPLEIPIPDFAEIGSLQFEKPDLVRFPCLALAFEACREGHTLPAVLNAANEVAVQAFLDEKISFVKIPEIIDETMNKHVLEKNPDLSDIMNADKWARIQANKIIRDLLKN